MPVYILHAPWGYGGDDEEAMKMDDINTNSSGGGSNSDSTNSHHHLVTENDLHPVLDSLHSFDEQFGLWMAQFPSLLSINLQDQTFHSLVQRRNVPRRDLSSLASSSSSPSSSSSTSPPSPGGPEGGEGEVRFLYVMQKEWAMVVPGEHGVDFIGTDDATTCHIVGIRNTRTGAVAVAHLDQPEGFDEIGAMEEAVSNGDNAHLELYLVGGFTDPAISDSPALSEAVLRYFCLKSKKTYLLMAARLGPANTMVDGQGRYAPVCRSLGFRCRDGAVFSGDFPAIVRGPAKTLRSAGMMSEKARPLNRLHYDPKASSIIITPFQLERNPGMRSFLRLDDQQILQYTSTSPLVEGPHFAQEMRQVMRLMLTWDQESMFPNNQPAVYKIPRLSLEELLEVDELQHEKKEGSSGSSHSVSLRGSSTRGSGQKMSTAF